MKLRFLPAVTVLLFLLVPAAHGEEVTLPSGYTPTNLVKTVGGSASSDTKCLNNDSQYGVAKAFDKKYYADNTRWIGHGSTFPQRAVWTFPEATIVDTVRIYNATYSGASNSPSDFTIAGSNDGLSWTTLDSESGVTGWSASQFRTFQFVNRTPYLKYRLEVTAAQGGNLTLNSSYTAAYAKESKYPGTYSVTVESANDNYVVTMTFSGSCDLNIVAGSRNEAEKLAQEQFSVKDIKPGDLSESYPLEICEVCRFREDGQPGCA